MLSALDWNQQVMAKHWQQERTLYEGIPKSLVRQIYSNEVARLESVMWAQVEVEVPSIASTVWVSGAQNEEEYARLSHATLPARNTLSYCKALLVRY